MKRVRNATVRSALCLSLVATHTPASHASIDVAPPPPSTTAYQYSPSWTSDLNYASSNALFARPTGAQVWLENNYAPWWETRVAHPIYDYDASTLETGVARLDTALNAEYTVHRSLRGWTYAPSPTAINNVYTFTPGSTRQQDRTGRSGQAAYLNLGIHPIKAVSGDIGAEILGNYDQRFWFPVNDEHRLYNDNRWGKIVRAQLKYETEPFMLRGFEGVRVLDWTGKNDLFALLPQQIDVEYYRRASGSVTPRGGEMRYTSSLGTLDVLGGTEIRWGYGSSVFARYDLPVYRNLETSLVYRNEDVPFAKVVPNSPEERRWAVSLNTSYPFSERIQAHAGILYQPFRLNQDFQDYNSVSDIQTDTTKRKDAFGFTMRTEMEPPKFVDRVGVGFTYLGAVAGNKEQLDLDATRTFLVNWTLSGSYLYRQPVVGPVPLTYEGTAANPGALIAAPRGPDDPFWVQWDNRKAHLGSLTFVFDTTPATPWFRYRPNILEDWNLNRDEDSEWLAAVQYRLAHYLSNTDRLYYYNEDRSLVYDPIFHTGALGTEHPLSSATGLLQWHRGKWHVTGTLSGGETLAGAGIAYTSATNFYKPSTVYMNSGISVDNSFVKGFVNYGRDVWGPADYHTQLGWAYHHVYQAGLSYIFLRDFESGFRYVGTRMANDYLGSDAGAFNEYSFFLTYHFGFEHNFSGKIASIGQPLPKSIPEAGLTVSDTSFTPDGSGPVRELLFTPRAVAESGVLSYQLVIRNAQGETVKKWEGGSRVPSSIRWDGIGPDGRPAPAGTYRATLTVSDLYGNEATSPAQNVTVQAGATPAETPVAPSSAVPNRKYVVKTTPEGLKVTLSSLVLFDVNQSQLKESAKEALKEVVELLRAYPNNVLRVAGHTDATGSEAYNLDLSLRRAMSVADYLVKDGNISRSRITFIGYGKKRPVATNKTEEGRQQNRRVEIEILK